MYLHVHIDATLHGSRKQQTEHSKLFELLRGFTVTSCKQNIQTLTSTLQLPIYGFRQTSRRRAGAEKSKGKGKIGLGEVSSGVRKKELALKCLFSFAQRDFPIFVLSFCVMTLM